MKQVVLTLTKSNRGYNIQCPNGKPVYKAPVSADRAIKAILALAAIMQKEVGPQ